jgi:hypothetical protein
MALPEVDPVMKANLELTALMEQKNTLPDNEFIGSLNRFCNALPFGLRIIFDLGIDLKPMNSLVDELRIRLQKGEILEPTETNCKLIVQSPLVMPGLISAADTIRKKRNPFSGVGTFMARDTETDEKLGQTALLEIDPTGISFSMVKKFNLPAAVIKQVTISNSKDLSLPLSPALSQTGEVITVAEWGPPADLG